jgi:hypothetical protein
MRGNKTIFSRRNCQHSATWCEKKDKWRIRRLHHLPFLKKPSTKQRPQSAGRDSEGSYLSRQNKKKKKSQKSWFRTWSDICAKDKEIRMCSTTRKIVQIDRSKRGNVKSVKALRYELLTSVSCDVRRGIMLSSFKKHFFFLSRNRQKRYRQFVCLPDIE